MRQHVLPVGIAMEERKIKTRVLIGDYGFILSHTWW